VRECPLVVTRQIGNDSAVRTLLAVLGWSAFGLGVPVGLAFAFGELLEFGAGSDPNGYMAAGFAFVIGFVIGLVLGFVLVIIVMLRWPKIRPRLSARLRKMHLARL
jgi:uncharacterized membrane protein YccC